MDLMLFVIGMLIGAISLIWIVVSLFRRNFDKRALIALVASIALMITGLFMPTGSNDVAEEDNIIENTDEELDEELDEAYEEVVEETESKDESKEEPEAVKSEEDNVSQKDLERASLETIRSNFEGTATVEYDSGSKIYNILPVDQDLINELTQLVMGNENMLEGWGSLVEGMTNLSASLKDTLGSGYVVNLLNPANADNVLLTCVDGVVFYNVADDL